MNAESAPKGAPQTFACQRDHLEVTRDPLGSKVDDAGRDGDGGFRVGGAVRTYSGRTGTVAEVRRVVPKAVSDALHAAGKFTNNGDHEIGVDFSSPDAVGEHRTDSWWLPRELAMDGAPRPYKAPRSHAKARREVSTR